MARLILEEGGQRKRFRLNDGKLTIGTSERCTLRLASPDVAEIHAELEMHGGSAMLRLKSGVSPATVKGRKIQGEHPMADGVPVSIGSAKLTVEYEGKEKESLVARRNVVTRAESAGARRGPTPAQARPRERKRSGVPSWAVILIGLVIGGLAWKYSATVIGGTADQGFDADTSYRRVKLSIAEGDSIAAFKELDRVEAMDLEPQWRDKFAALREEMVERKAAAELATFNQKGTEYLDTQLKRFETNYLKGKPKRPNVRVFLKRVKVFMEEWPQHPEIPWARRMEQRYSKVVSLDEPPTFDDIAFEVKTLTWAMPRNYKKAFLLIDQFVEEATSDDRESALTLRDEKDEERREYFLDRLQEADHQWNKKKDKGAAVEWLVTLVTMIGDEAMENEAAELLLSLPGVDGPLRGYKLGRPDTFTALVANDLVAAKARELGLLP